MHLNGGATRHKIEEEEGCAALLSVIRLKKGLFYFYFQSFQINASRTGYFTAMYLV